MSDAFRRETKYQWTKLHRSGRTLAEIKALTKGASVGLTYEYAQKKQVMDLEKLQGGIERLTMTRIDAKKIAFDKFFRPRDGLGQRREEMLATWLTTRRSSLVDWKRDGNLIRKGKPNKPRPGSSKNIPIGQTRITGEDKILRDWKRLLKSWKMLADADKRSLKKDIRSAARSITTKVY